MNKLIIFIILTFINTSYGYTPSVESLFRNSSNQEIGTNTIVGIIDIEKVVKEEASELVEDISYKSSIKILFGNENPDRPKFTQVDYKDGIITESTMNNNSASLATPAAVDNGIANKIESSSSSRGRYQRKVAMGSEHIAGSNRDDYENTYAGSENTTTTTTRATAASIATTTIGGRERSIKRWEQGQRSNSHGRRKSRSSSRGRIKSTDDERMEHLARSFSSFQSSSSQIIVDENNELLDTTPTITKPV